MNNAVVAAPFKYDRLSLSGKHLHMLHLRRVKAKLIKHLASAAVFRKQFLVVASHEPVYFSKRAVFQIVVQAAVTG